MGRNTAPAKVRQGGAFRVRAAESRASRVTAKASNGTPPPSSSDRKLARALLRERP